MKVRDRMIYAGIVTSDLKRRLPAHVREFYRDLLHVCDDYGRFEADPALLRAVLFAPILNRVSERDVQGYLLQLAASENGDIKLYTVRGKGYGKVTKWRQLKLKNLVAEYPDEDGDAELPLASPVPIADPPRPAPKRKERKKEVCERGREAPGTHDTRLAEHCLDELATRWPKHDLAACLQRAKRYVTKQRGGDAAVTVGWFETHWLTGEAEAAKVEPVIRYVGPSNDTLERESAAAREEWRKLPEPPAGTIQHAMWLEAQKAG